MVTDKVLLVLLGPASSLMARDDRVVKVETKQDDRAQAAFHAPSCIMKDP